MKDTPLAALQGLIEQAVEAKAGQLVASDRALLESIGAGIAEMVEQGAATSAAIERLAKAMEKQAAAIEKLAARELVLPEQPAPQVTVNVPKPPRAKAPVYALDIERGPDQLMRSLTLTPLET